MGQSTNDVFPTAIHVAVALGIEDELLPACASARRALAEKAAAMEGHSEDRPHAPDRCHPLSLGQEFGGFARQLERSADRAGLGAGGGVGIAHRRHGGRQRHRTRIPNSPAASARRSASPRESASARRRIISRPTPSATGWSSVTGNCGRSPQRCSPWRTTSVGSAPGRSAAFTKSSFPICSPAARSCPARSTR